MSESRKSKVPSAAEFAVFKEDRRKLESSLAASRKAQDRLTKERDLYRDFIERANEGVIVIQDMTIRFANPRMREMTGYAAGELTGMPFERIVQPEEFPRMVDARRGAAGGENAAAIYSGALKSKSGDTVWVEFTCGITEYDGRPAEFLIIRDITDLKALRDRFLSAQKMEITARLVGGIAHDFNNLLMAIMNYSAFIKSELGPNSPSYHDVEEIGVMGSRAAALIKRLLIFSKPQALDVLSVDVNKQLVGMEKMLCHFLREDIEIVILPEAKNAMVEMDPSHLEQIIMNLAVNSRDAMLEGGRFTISADNRSFGAREKLGEFFEIEAGKYLVLRFSDTGAGMDDKIKKYIFEPFFTTKNDGRGTGLGLSTVLSIVRLYHGGIIVESKPGRGTTFEIFLPVSHKSSARKDEDLLDAADIRGSGETVLVVEGVTAVRDVITRMLSRLGYNAIAARHAEEALVVADLSKIDVLLADVVMPRMSLKSMTAQIRKLHPEARMIFMAGYAQSEELKEVVSDGKDGFLQKPFIEAALAKKIREILGKNT